MKPRPKAHPGRIHFQILTASGRIQLRMIDIQFLLSATSKLSPVPSHRNLTKTVQAENVMKSLLAEQGFGILHNLSPKGLPSMFRYSDTPTHTKQTVQKPGYFYCGCQKAGTHSYLKSYLLHKPLQ